MNRSMTWEPVRRWVQALHPPALGVAGVAAGLGLASAHACGTPWRVPEAVATGVLALLAQASGILYRGSDAPKCGLPAAQRRDAAQVLGMVVAGGCTLLAARSGVHLLALGGLAALWAGVSLHPVWGLARRGRGAVVAAVGTWLIVLGADGLQRGALSGMAAIAGVGMALLVAAAVRARESGRASVGEVLVLSLLAHAWVAYWWHAWWLPTPAVWALGSSPLSLAAAWAQAFPASGNRQSAWGWWLALLAALAHGLLLAAAFSAVAWMR